MPYPANVYRVLIASPGDVNGERDIVESAIHAWNDEHSMDRGVVFLPVRWERTSPRQGAAGQDVINEDLVATCDALVGVFWTRLGRPTGNDRSGTVEEIREFARDGRPAGLFFKKANLPMSHDPEQYRPLREFETEVEDPASDFRGLAKHFRTRPELQDAVGRYLTETLRRLPLNALVAAVETAAAQDTAILRTADDDDDQDELGLLEVLPAIQDAASEIWTRLAVLDEVGAVFQQGPSSAEPEVTVSDPQSVFATTGDTFSRIASWMNEGAAGLEAQMPAMRDAWARLRASDALFANLLPYETQEDRKRARGLLSTIPGAQDDFLLKRIPGFLEAKAGLDAYKGMSAPLNRAVRRLDRAISDTIETMIEGRAVATHLTEALDNRSARVTKGDK